jgi:hypothetical protein
MPTFDGGRGAATPGGLTLPTSTSSTTSSSSTTSPSSAGTAAVATYIACLNTNGLTSVKTMADVKMVDPTITANSTALAACAAQKPAK